MVVGRRCDSGYFGGRAIGKEVLYDSFTDRVCRKDSL